MSTKRGGPSSDESPGRLLFQHEARRDGKPVCVLSGHESGAGVDVESEVHSVIGLPGQDSFGRRHHFASGEQAHRFVEELLTSLEYLGCSVT